MKERTLTKQEYDSIFNAYKNYLNTLSMYIDNKEIYKDLRNTLYKAQRNPVELNKVWYSQDNKN